MLPRALPTLLAVGALVFTLPARAADGGAPIDILYPELDAVVGPLLHVEVESASDIVGIHAKIDTVEFDLMAWQGSSLTWDANAPIDALSRGPKTLVLTATTATGATSTTSRSFVHDEPPVITVVLPQYDSVARADVHVVATCRDDDAVGCRNFTATFGTHTLNGASSIDGTVALRSEDGQRVLVTFSA